MSESATAVSLSGGEDRALAGRIAAGDVGAFEGLMRLYNRRLYRLARATLRDRTEAEDALQDAYVCAYRSIGSFRGEASLATWLSRLVLNECFARMRREVRRQNVIPMVSASHHIQATQMIVDDSDSPEGAVGRLQIRDLLERRVDELPEHYRTVFVLRSVEELSVDETAECLGIAAETVRSRHFRAKAMLRESLERDVSLAERDLFEFGGTHCNRIVERVLQRISAPLDGAQR
jgi:RNA polymerase sigma-70 factor (ECF subfamily)